MLRAAIGEGTQDGSTAIGSQPPQADARAPKSFVPHHMQRLSVAAVKGDAKGVRAAANSLKRKVMGNAASAAAVGARA